MTIIDHTAKLLIYLKVGEISKCTLIVIHLKLLELLLSARNNTPINKIFKRWLHRLLEISKFKYFI